MVTKMGNSRSNIQVETSAHFLRLRDWVSVHRVLERGTVLRGGHGGNGRSQRYGVEVILEMGGARSRGKCRRLGILWN